MVSAARYDTSSPIDMHVHLIGNGSSGSGCWIRLSGWNRVLARYMLWTLSMPQSMLTGDFDRRYVEVLSSWMKESSLGAACLFAHDQVYDESGSLLTGKGSFYVPNDYMFEVAAAHPQFLPTASIHPARKDALDELDRCIAKGAVMLKLLPNCHNVDCRNPAYRPFWKKLADSGMPFLAHTGGELSVQTINRAYQDPSHLREPLEQGVTVIAAHAASASFPFDRDYFGVFASMIERYPNLYADNSALNSPFRSKAFRPCLQEPVLSRVVHGSDMPIPVSSFYARCRGLMSGAEARRCNKIPNILERDVQIKRSMGFPDSTFSRGWELLKKRLPS